MLSANPWDIALIGAILWLISFAAFWYLHHLPEMVGKRSLSFSILLWTLTFVPLFTASAIATGLVIHRLS
jgi:hypothetical protein